MLNQLDRELPEGLVVDAAWLERHGYYRSLRQKYVNQGWLEQPVRRVYRRPRGDLSWEQVVVSLQTLLDHPVSVGGRTALELHGYSHYLPHTRTEVHLYRDHRLPTWLHALPLPQHFVEHRSTRLFSSDSPAYTALDLSKSRSDDNMTVEARAGLTTIPWGHWDWPLVLSTPERALLELLDELPSRESFHQVDKLTESLVTLSPRRLQQLLESCQSVKVKRLFFFFADRHAHSWLDRINRANVDLGSGKRALVRGGRLDTTYNITVPEDMDAVQ